jgi:hypothetical protein
MHAAGQGLSLKKSNQQSAVRISSSTQYSAGRRKARCFVKKTNSLNEVNSVSFADRCNFFRRPLRGGKGIEFTKHFLASTGKQHHQGLGSVRSGFGRMWNASREKNCAANSCGNGSFRNHKIHVTMDDIEDGIFLGVKVEGNSGPGPVALLDNRECAAGLRTIEFYDLLIANDFYMFTGLPVHQDRTEQLG